MQLFWISPLILWPMLKWPRKLNLLLLGALVAGGIVCSFTVTYVNRFPAGVLAGVGPEWEDKNKYEYVTTHTRCTPWIIGLSLGYILHNTKNKVRLTELQVCGGWLLAAVGFLGALYGLLPFQQPDYVYDALESSLYNCLHRAIWSVSVGWIIFACVKGYGGPVNKILSWGAFHPFSRLTYCIYLVHYPFMSYRQSTTRTPVYLNNINTMSQSLSDMVFSILLAALMSLVFEIPAITIKRILLQKDKTQLNGKTDMSRVVSKRSIEEGTINQEFKAQDR
ncbi:Nose resistant to fluoxetine protein 6 [Zootermopsis nevadensis]|uniref:Nose resistant to fluoxetine protein 6 n=2 Tax=Zootermopsis nevadensis TaxID=136037 RepID=A0A067RBW4_ZOONE|nr:Nose resistant to fluoxetine protein 6 [Zootermopsis nevadensis]